MFKQMVSPQFPPRQWAVYGDPGSGKSHFASQMKTPALVVDSDARFTEQLRNAAGQIYQLSDNHTDNLDADTIARLLKENMPGSGVRTIVVDSLTAILKPIINAAMSDIEHKRVKNGVAAFKGKAASMSQIQDAVSGWGVDSLWIWHTHESRDAQAKLVQRASIPETELVRLRRSLNAILRLDVSPDGQRSVLIEWARNGKSGIRLVDKAGGWRGMPELIEATMYSDGVKDERAPALFSSPLEAVAWGYEQGCFNASQHAHNAYEECKRLKQPKTAAEMAQLWIAEVNSRVAEKTATINEESAEELFQPA